MPRSNRSRRRTAAAPADDERADLSRILMTGRRTETKRNGAWTVQPIAAASATKAYVCPGCGLSIDPGTAHIVAWRADGLMGEADDLAARRHWHSHCWKIS